MLEAFAAVAACDSPCKPPSPMKQKYMKAFSGTMPPPAAQTPGSSTKKKKERSEASKLRTKDVNSMKFKLYRMFEELASYTPEKKRFRENPVSFAKYLYNDRPHQVSFVLVRPGGGEDHRVRGAVEDAGGGEQYDWKTSKRIYERSS